MYLWQRFKLESARVAQVAKGIVRVIPAWLKPTTWQHPWRTGLSLLGVLLLLYMLFTGWQVYRHILSLRGHIAKLRTIPLSDAAALEGRLLEVQRDVAHLRRDLWLPLAVAPHLGWLPGVGPSVQAGAAFFAAGESFLAAVTTVWGVIRQPATDVLGGRAAPEQALAAVSAQLVQHTEELEEATKAIHRVAAQIRSVDAKRLPPRISRQVAQVQNALPLLTAAFDLLPHLPRLVPESGEWTYLLLAQNNDELRPTGGFISAIGAITVIQGVPRLAPFRDSYDVEDWSKPHGDPPEALRKYMGLDLWVTRDGNWWPDFPTSAQAIAQLYESNKGGQVRGVLAADMFAAAQLLEALTPLPISGGEPLKSGQVSEMLRESWGLPPQSLVTSGVVITATRPFTAIELMLSFNKKQGRAWFDSVVLENMRHPGANLVRNGSFEGDVDRNGWPSLWQATGLSSEDRVVTTYAHSGQKSLLIVGDSQNNKTVAQRIAIEGEGGARFRVAAESRAEAVEDRGGAYALTVTFLSRERESHVASFPPLTHDWATAGSGEAARRWWAHRKDLVNRAMQAAWAKILAKPANVRWLDLLDTTRAMLEQRHIQLYVDDPLVQAVVERYGWGGTMSGSGGDYLCVVDSNVGYNKVSANVEQMLDYHVSIDADGRAQAWLSVRYHNRSAGRLLGCEKFKQYIANYEALTHGCYWDYVRVYVPAESELLAAMGGDEPVEVLSESGQTVFATSLALRPGERRELHFRYALPPGTMREGTYTLFIRKQAGTEAVPIKVSIEGAKRLVPQRGDLQPEEVSPRNVVYLTDLRTDRRVAVKIGH